MPLTIGQMNELTKLLIESNDDSGISSMDLSKKLDVDEDVILKSIESMQERTCELIFVNTVQVSNNAGSLMMVKIPKSEKWTAEHLLRDGGWGKIFDEHYAELKAKKEKTERRLQIEEDSWIAAKDNAEKANIIAKRANVISIVSVIIALVALVYSFLKNIANQH